MTRQAPRSFAAVLALTLSVALWSQALSPATAALDNGTKAPLVVAAATPLVLM
ncbi:hypothetical protein [Novosphingobium sp. M1R2S20]|uniref:Uncharacterized protein n=1 Tax=Novosphingobium rhizovicinum TaxID=3228928 RepID=A0ABV3RAN6_9SPHN